MFTKKQANGKIAVFEKFYDEKRKKYRQARVTMNNSSRQSMSEARRLLAIKIDSMLKEPTEEEILLEKKKSILVSELYGEWRVIRKKELKETTYFTQGQIFDVLLRDILNRPLFEITTQDIHDIIFAGNRSDTTKRNYKAFLKQLFDYAVDLNYIEENIVKKIKLPKRKITVEDVRNSENRYVDIEDLQKLIEYVNSGKMNKSNNHKYYAENQKRYLYAYIFMFCTGLRIGELQALRYINVEENVARIENSLNRKTFREEDRVLTTVKTVQSYRKVILNEQALEALNYFKNNKLDDDFIFVNQQGKIMVYKTMQQNFKKLCERALGKKKTPHMLRHGFVSYASEIGVNEKAIMSQVGHAKSDMTLHYTHLTKNMRNETANVLNKMALKL
ncbi:tyrosine-type recombinase/integrase [Lactococcus petauri]|uniref:tyrosine-type recombinase/integrase n=1 Tax=Lactococcus petauri TaxID=1940789 RepID=UPI001F58E91F|nr:site-specific integrase [Lactococcus petauri]